MDFGISHLVISTSTAETATSAQKGSLRWQARELLVDRPSSDDSAYTTFHHTKESDIWAFSMTCLVISIFNFQIDNSYSMTTLFRRRYSLEKSLMQIIMIFRLGCEYTNGNFQRSHQTWHIGRKLTSLYGICAECAGSGKAAKDRQLIA